MHVVTSGYLVGREKEVQTGGMEMEGSEGFHFYDFLYFKKFYEPYENIHTHTPK